MNDGDFMSDERDPTASSLPDLRYNRELAKVFKQYGLDEIEIETGGQRVLLRRGGEGGVGATMVPAAMPAAPAPVAALPVAPAAAPSAPVAAEVAGDFITSPFVGTFYRSARPDSPPFAEVGARVAKGQTVCIVEAMKLFNELEAEFECEVLEALVENGQAVEYGAKLFRVRKL
jgi:acetyl-CoA carboxylase biotin carboxyl carrier protein